MRKAIVFSLLLLVIQPCLFAQTSYYWYKGMKIPLKEHIPCRYVLLESSDDTMILKNNSFNIIKKGLLFLNQKNSSENSTKYVWAIIDGDSPNSLNRINGIKYKAPSFLTEDGIEVILSNYFYVKLKSIDDEGLLHEFARKEKVDIIENNKYMPLWYTLSCSDESNGNAIEMANYFYETQLFQAAVPDLMSNDLPTCVNDEYFTNQWGLKNTGQNNWTSGIDINYCQSSQITKGSPYVIVAVIDHGVQLNHPDLTNIYPISYDSEHGTSPSTLEGTHGTRCAGIIGAFSNNEQGVAGIAPECPIMSISNKFDTSPNSRMKRTDGINFAVANGASVINNSWVSSVQFQAIDDAIDNAITNGRNGLGCVVVFSSGNDNGTVSYPANCNPKILVVGAMSPCGERKNPNSCDGESLWGSNYGTELDIVAPGVRISTTTNGGYDHFFNGTSSACPHVTAVAALVLSRNRNLTHLQVANILESTAQKVGNYHYTLTRGRPNGGWNEEMGYGLVDAYAAVMAAVPPPPCTGTTEFIDQTLNSSTTVTGCNINAQDVVVRFGSTLTLDATNTTTINGPFEIQQGSSLVVE